MDRATHCPNCFRAPAPAARCAQCGFDAATYDGESNDLLPLFAALAEGKYRIGRVLGEGGFGVVYAGWVHGLERTVAIKEFFPATDNPLARRQGLTVTARPRYQAEFADWKQQFLREAQLLAQFSHPRIVQVHDILEEHNTIYLIMERLEGQTLSDALGGLEQRGEELAAGHALPPEQAAPLLHAALEALDILHGHAPPVIHRDLTPYNLFLVDGRIDRLKVLDFGLARLGARTQSIASIAARVGNPGFAAPEQLGLYPGAIGPATDFYTLGATLYTALTGVAPPNAQQRCDGGRLLPPPPLPPHLDPALAQIIRACLEISPQRRPQSVAEIRQRLAAGTLIPPPEPEPEPEPPPPKPRPRPEFPFRADDGAQNPPPPFSKGGSAGSKGESTGVLDWNLRESPSARSWWLLAWKIAVVVVLGPMAVALWGWTAAELGGWLLGLIVGTVLLISMAVALWKEATIRNKPTTILASQVFRDMLKDGTDGPVMIALSAGTFLMGSPKSEWGRDQDERQHKVSVRAFAIGQYAVTFAEYDRFCETTGRKPPSDAGWGRGTRPVIDVSWHDALAYTEWLSKQTGQSYRLPTEAEWEYAARAGTTTPFWTGRCVTTDQANYDGRYSYGAPDCGAKTGVYRGQTQPVGSFKPNPWGLHDTMGNVWEWTCSAYDKGYGGAETKCTTKDTSAFRSLRGGSWDNVPAWVRSAARFRFSPMTRNYRQGFRLARSL